MILVLTLLLSIGGMTNEIVNSPPIDSLTCDQLWLTDDPEYLLCENSKIDLDSEFDSISKDLL